MKNLSLQMSPVAVLKTMVNKSESNNDKPVSTEQPSFKTILSNQLQSRQQAKQLQDRQLQDRKSAENLSQSRQLQDKQLEARQDLTKQNEIKPKVKLDVKLDVKTQVAPAAEKNQLPSNELVVKTGGEQDSARQIDAATVLADKKAVLVAAAEAKAELPLNEEAAPNEELPQIKADENNAAHLIAAFNVAVVNPQAQAQSAEAAGFRQKSMDTVLTQALTQSKAVALAADKDATLAAQESKASTQKANWLDGVLPAAKRQAAGDELVQSKVQQASVQQSAIQQNVLQQTIAQQALAQQTGLQQNTTQQSSVQQNLAQQTGAMTATMPQALQATPTAGPALAAAQAGSSNYINVPLGKSGWDQAISQKVMWMAGEGGVQSATLTLNPPDLGPLQVVIHVNNDMVEAQFMSDNADVRQALQDGLSNLRDKMNEAGIQLGQTNVSSGGQAQQEFQQAEQGRRAGRMAGNEATSTIETESAQRVSVRTANGLVDTFA